MITICLHSDPLLILSFINSLRIKILKWFDQNSLVAIPAKFQVIFPGCPNLDSYELKWLFYRKIQIVL